MLRRFFPRRTGKTVAPVAGDGHFAHLPPPADAPHIWFHAPRGLGRDAIEALHSLYVRLEQALDTPPVLLVTGDAPGDGFATSPFPTLETLPAFLAHWRPCASFWLGEGNLSIAQATSPAPVLIKDSPVATNQREVFSAHLTGPFKPDPPVLSVQDAEAEDVSGILKGRPVWLAALPTEEELPAIIDAHRAACKVSHRLLLFLVLEHGQGDATARTLARTGWQVRNRDGGHDPDDVCEIYVIQGREELGLWYRLAPITFLGGSFSQGAASSPRAPASLGSAVICGPESGAHLQQIKEMSAADAIERVSTPDGLKRALLRLLAPDQTAQLAANGWAQVTIGAPLLNQIVRHVTPLCMERSE